MVFIIQIDAIFFLDADIKPHVDAGRMDQVKDLPIAGIPPGKSDASGGIGPKHIVTSTSAFSARCRPTRPISPVEFQLMVCTLEGAAVMTRKDSQLPL